MSLEKLVTIGKEIGGGLPYWVQGAGGNVSVKLGGKLFVKASGTRLDRFGEKGTVACLDLRAVRSQLELLGNRLEKQGYSHQLEEDYAQLLKEAGRNSDPQFGRPSMEAGFHALLPGRYVLHFHALSAVLMAHVLKKRAHEFASWLDESQADLRVVPPEKPGLVLSFAVASIPHCEVMVLDAHGVILHSDSEDLFGRWKALEKSFLSRFGWKDLSEQIEGNVSFSEMSKSQVLPQTLRIFFPDSAVFKGELLGQIQSRSGGKFKTQFSSDLEQGLEEILLATRILEVKAPDLAEFPAELGVDLAQIPTEKFRRGEGR